MTPNPGRSFGRQKKSVVVVNPDIGLIGDPHCGRRASPGCHPDRSNNSRRGDRGRVTPDNRLDREKGPNGRRGTKTRRMTFGCSHRAASDARPNGKGVAQPVR